MAHIIGFLHKRTKWLDLCERNFQQVDFVCEIEKKRIFEFCQ